jgi:hypothetical protein
MRTCLGCAAERGLVRLVDKEPRYGNFFTLQEVVMFKFFCSIIVLMAFTASAAASQSPLLAKIMTDSQLDEVVGGDGCFTPTTTSSNKNTNTKSKGMTKTAAKTGPKGKAKGKNRIKGNNGWGNGADPSNPGSGSGKTAPSKTANGTAGPGVNTNPTRSTGR